MQRRQQVINSTYAVDFDHKFLSIYAKLHIKQLYNLDI